MMSYRRPEVSMMYLALAILAAIIFFDANPAIPTALYVVGAVALLLVLLERDLI